MGKTIDKIVVSSIAPKNTNVLWDDGENLKIFRNGKWESTSKSNHNNEEYIVPDWKANGGEEGYIKNRTHYTTKVNIVTVSKENITSTPYKIIPMDPGVYYEENGVERYVTLKPQYKINNEDIEWIDFSASGPPIQLAHNNGFLYIKDRFNYPRNNFTFWNESITYLSEKFIPNTIARSINYELHHIKLDISKTDSNVTTLNDNSVSLTDRCVCDLYNGYYDKENALIHNGELYNGIITGISGGKLVQYNVNLETGEITLKHEIDIAELYNKISSL